MPEEIDYKAIVDTLQHENERLRLRIVKLRSVQSPLAKIDMDAIRAFAEKNYIVIMVACLLLSSLVRPIITSVIRLIRAKGDKTHEG